MAATAGLALACAGSVALAAPEVDRATFIKRADAICKPAYHRATPKLQSGARHIADEEWQAAQDNLGSGFRILRNAYREIAGLTRPRGDVQKIGHWIDLHKRQFRVGIDAAHQYGQEHIDRAHRLTQRYFKLVGKTNRTLRDWRFKHCR
jgi:hypothetical protein